MNRVDRKTNIDWDLVPNDAYGPVAALVTIADQAVEDAGPWPGWRDDLWEASEEIGRLRKRVAELERALGDLLEALTHHENRLTDEALQQERRARRALDRERTGGEERLYVVVEGSGPDTRFVEIENEVGESVSVPRRPAKGEKLSRIGPLYREPHTGGF